MKPVEALLNTVDFKEIEPRAFTPAEGDLYATHAGVLNVEGLPPLRVYRLNDGRAVIHADDMHALFGGFMDAVAQGEGGHG